MPTIIVDINGIPTVAVPRDDPTAPPVALYSLRLPHYSQHVDYPLIRSGPPPIETTRVAVSPIKYDFGDDHDGADARQLRCTLCILTTVCMIAGTSILVAALLWRGTDGSN